MEVRFRRLGNVGGIGDYRMFMAVQSAITRELIAKHLPVITGSSRAAAKGVFDNVWLTQIGTVARLLTVEQWRQLAPLRSDGEIGGRITQLFNDGRVARLETYRQGLSEIEGLLNTQSPADHLFTAEALEELSPLITNTTERTRLAGILELAHAAEIDLSVKPTLGRVLHIYKPPEPTFSQEQVNTVAATAVAKAVKDLKTPEQVDAAVEAAMKPLRDRITTLKTQEDLDAAVEAAVKPFRDRITTLKTQEQLDAAVKTAVTKAVKGLRTQKELDDAVEAAVKPFRDRITTLRTQEDLDRAVEAAVRPLRDRIATLKTQEDLDAAVKTAVTEATKGLREELSGMATAKRTPLEVFHNLDTEATRLTDELTGLTTARVEIDGELEKKRTERQTVLDDLIPEMDGRKGKADKAVEGRKRTIAKKVDDDIKRLENDIATKQKKLDALTGDDAVTALKRKPLNREIARLQAEKVEIQNSLEGAVSADKLLKRLVGDLADAGSDLTEAEALRDTLNNEIAGIESRQSKNTSAQAGVKERITALAERVKTTESELSAVNRSLTKLATRLRQLVEPEPEIPTQS